MTPKLFIEHLKVEFNSGNLVQEKIDMLNYLETITIHRDINTPEYVINYWNEVKNQIEKL